jgi:PAS domain-containing protein
MELWMQLIAYCFAIGAFTCAIYWYRHSRQSAALRTQLSETNAKLVERLSMLETSLASAGVGTYVANIATREFDIDSSTAQLAGITRAHGIVDFEQWQATIHPDHYQRVMEHIRGHLAAKKSYTVDYRINVGDTYQSHGQPRWVRSHAMLVIDKRPWRTNRHFDDQGIATRNSFA